MPKRYRPKKSKKDKKAEEKPVARVSTGFDDPMNMQIVYVAQSSSEDSGHETRDYVELDQIRYDLFYAFVSQLWPLLLCSFYPQEAAKKKGSVADTEVGLVTGIHALSAAVCFILLRLQVVRIGPKRQFYGGIILLGLSCVAFSCVVLFDDWLPFILTSVLLRGLMGVGHALMITIDRDLTGTIFPFEPTPTKQWLVHMADLGYVFSPLIGAIIYTSSDTDRDRGFISAFLITGFPMIFLTLFWSRREYNCLKTARLKWYSICTPQVQMACLIAAIVNMMFAFLCTSMAVYLEKEMNVTTVGFLLFLLCLSHTLSFRFCIMRGLAKILGLRSIYMLILITMSICLLIISFLVPFGSPSLQTYIAGGTFFLFGGAFGGLHDIATTHSYNVAVRKLHPRPTSQVYEAVSAMWIIVLYLSFGVGAVLGGWLSAANGFENTARIYSLDGFVHAIVNFLEDASGTWIYRD